MSFRATFEHRDALLRSALDEFCDRGFDAASINRILTSSGVSKGQLYHHFTSKEGLYLALVEWAIDQKVSWFVTHPMTTYGDFIDQLTTQLRATLEFAKENPAADRLTRAVLAERGRPIFRAVQDRFGFDPDSMIGALIEHHHANAAFRHDLSLEFVQRTVLLVLNNAPDLLDLRSAGDLEHTVDELAAFLRAGLMR